MTKTDFDRLIGIMESEDAWTRLKAMIASSSASA
jgi:hypothetical protein